MKNPKIRFSGFTDTLKKCKVKDFATESNIKGHTGLYATKLTVKLHNKGVKKADILTNGSDNTQYYTRFTGQFIYGKQNFFNGAMGVIPIDLNQYESTKDVPAFDIAKSVDTAWFYYYISRPEIYKPQELLCTGTGSKRFHVKDFFKLQLYMPILNEQKEIANLFSDIDKKISTEEELISKLKVVKNSMLSKMFPSENSVIPELRFSNFTAAWEQCKFSELYKKSSEKNDGSIGIDRNITVATMQFKTDIQVSTLDYLKTYYTFNIGDIAFEGHQSKEFRYGRFVENDIGNGIISHIFYVFRPITNYDLNFWKYAINNENIMKNVLSKSTKSATMMHDLVIEDFLNETFLIPNINEQKIIGQFLNKLDHLITLHQQKYEKLVQVKKALLNKMFVEE